MLVSNAEFLEFVEAGGYTEEGRGWWSEEGWQHVQDLGVHGPRFWVGRTHYRMLLEVTDRGRGGIRPTIRLNPNSDGICPTCPFVSEFMHVSDCRHMSQL